MYYVYVHTVPNGKLYIGQTQNTDARWNRGDNYKDNINFTHDIEMYGWDNIKHEVIMCCDTREEALHFEAMYIVMLGTESEDVGYNRTSLKKSLLDAYEKRGSIEPADDEIEPDKNVFQQYNKSRTDSLMLIDEWIFSERDKKIMIRRCLDGLKYQDLANETGLSERQLKRIVRSSEKILEKHL